MKLLHSDEVPHTGGNFESVESYLLNVASKGAAGPGDHAARAVKFEKEALGATVFREVSQS